MDILDRISRLPVIGFDVARDRDVLAALHGESQALLDEATADPFRTVTDVSGWSPAQHIFHAGMINEAILKWLQAQCEGSQATEATGRPNAIGWVALFTGRLPRGRAKTPKPFAPPEDPDRGALKQLLKQNEERLEFLSVHLPHLRLSNARRDHPHLGVLNPREWLRFIRIHTDHHQRIIRNIVDAQ